MQEDWEQYSDHLPLYFNGLNLYVTELPNYNTQFIKEGGWLTPWRTLFPSAPYHDQCACDVKIKFKCFFHNKKRKAFRNFYFFTHMPAHLALVWCVYNIARATYVYYTCCLGHCNKENRKKKIKNIKLNSWSFFFSLC